MNDDDLKGKKNKYGSHIDHRTSWLKLADKKLPDLGDRSIIEYIKQERPEIKDPAGFIASIFEEGMAKRMASGDNFKRSSPLGLDSNFPYSGPLDFGLDTIGDNLNNFVKKGYLDSSVKDRMNVYKFTREDGNVGLSADFQNMQDVIDAKYAYMKDAEENINKNYSDFSPKAKEFFKYVNYNSGPVKAKEMIQSFQDRGYFENDKFAEDGFEPEYWKEPYKYSMRRFQGADMLSNEIEDLRRKPIRTAETPIDIKPRESPFDKTPVDVNMSNTINPLQTEYSLGGILGGAGKGAMMGAKLGSIVPGIGNAVGAIGGGLIGGISSFFKNRRSNNEQDIEQQQNVEQQNEMNMSNIMGNLNLSNSSNLPMGYGGQKYSAGGMINPLDEFNVGGTHEQNPLGGIPQGKNQNGQMQTVEEGETKFRFKEGDYIFSNRLTL